MRRFLVMFLCCMLCLSTALADVTVNISFAGDVTLGSEEKKRNQETSFVSMVEKLGYEYFFAHVKDFFATDDLTVVNLEGVLSDSAKGENTKKTYRFRGAPEYTEILKLGNVEVVTVANNHTQDFGERGYNDTLMALQRAGLNAFGNKMVYTYEKDGVKLAFISMNSTTFYPNRKWARVEIPRLKAEEGVDAVIFIVHAGSEYSKKHTALQSDYAHTAIDMGADLVVMHHPHVVQGIEIYNNRSIVYSIGNFCFGGNKDVRAIETMVLKAELTFADDGTYKGQQLSLYPAHISGTQEYNDYQPRFVTGDAAREVLRLVQIDTKFDLPPYNEETGCATLDYLPVQ